jgi:hypothetical protein
LNRRDGNSLVATSARACVPSSMADAACVSAAMPAPQMPWWLLISIGRAPSSPCSMLANPGMPVSPPDEPVHSIPTSSSFTPAACRQSCTARAARSDDECSELPASSMA